jgi:hypothetical protein
MVNCAICHRPIALVPSAQQRAARYGGTSRFYESLFDTHADCLIKKRNQETSDLIRKSYAQHNRVN